MKKAFYIGFGVAFLLLVLGYVTKYTGIFGTIATGIGIVFIAIGSLVGGVFIDGRQMQANYHTETKEDRDRRHKTLLVSGVIGLPHLVVGGILFMI